jgi:hypothetical protein
MKRFGVSEIVMAVVLISVGTASAGVVDLTAWTVESYPFIEGAPADATWTVSADEAFFSVNAQQSLLYSDFDALYKVITARVQVGSNDNDYFGFAIGFNPGDTTNSAASYLLVDWKQENQFTDMPGDATPGSTGYKGLALSQVFGTPTADEFWGHTDFSDENPSGGLTEIGRGSTLGNVGWANLTPYEFRFEILPSSLRVFVDGSLEFDVDQTISGGRFALYDFSQSGVTFSNVGQSTIPEPSTLATFTGLLGMGLIGYWRKRRRT